MCRSWLVGLFEAFTGRSGGVTSAGRLSLLPAISNRTEKSVRSWCRKMSTFRSKIDHKLLAGGFGKGARLYMRGPWREGKPELGYQLPLTPEQFFSDGA